MSQLDKCESKNGKNHTMPDASASFQAEVDSQRAAIEAALGHAGGTTMAIRDGALKALSEDKTLRSATSMTSAIDKFNELGKGNEEALQFYRNDQFAKTFSDPAGNIRGAAILYAAAGETRLSKGTFIAKDQGAGYDNTLSQLRHAVEASFQGRRDDQFNYILPGKNIDLGGHAMTELQIAKSALEYAKKESDSVAPGKDSQIANTETNGLNQIEQRIRLDLQKIYGKHDITSIYGSLENFTYKLNQEAVADLRDEVKARLKDPGTADPQFNGKLWRDLALINLAVAGTKVGYNGIGHGGDAVSAKTMLNEAQTALDKARNVDGKNEDLPQLDKIAKEIGRMIPERAKT